MGHYGESKGEGRSKHGKYFNKKNHYFESRGGGLAQKIIRYGENLSFLLNAKWKNRIPW